MRNLASGQQTEGGPRVAVGRTGAARVEKQRRGW
jgi:hypothetical protein